MCDFVKININNSHYKSSHLCVWKIVTREAAKKNVVSLESLDFFHLCKNTHTQHTHTHTAGINSQNRGNAYWNVSLSDEYVY